MITPSLSNFLKTGTRPASDRERSAMLDECRSFIQTLAAEAKNWVPPETPAQVEQIKRNAEVAKAQREQAQRDLEKKHAEQSKKMAASKPAPRDRFGRSAAEPMPAKPSPKAAAPAPETERERLRKEYSKITDPDEKRTFRIRHWTELSGPMKAPQPRK
jgi:hypothetical protein